MRATTGDKISLIGGTLGLFTGISFVSAVEIIFWIGKALVQKVSSREVPRKPIKIVG